ncbi:putative 2-hydroxyacid dehydrogenase [Botrimarina colliarenosi]|uniref:Putative 2-hydroxyacid dehydrogenase n=1 Tax=Botrimarina colliarenosi TaxID=2528001 RepID=A0A5C6AJ93_9BACT|nr:D-2-hydroxyacid dehydrogenase [Botrimarina colliarenosi]TWT99699.1 putative 2-hydroxyacid dehydrogenase [Botrimarina colliarenosi]
MPNRSKSSEKIVLCYPVEPQHLRQIEKTLDELGVEAELVNAGQERIAEELPTATIYCGHAKTPVPWAETVKGGRLRWIQSSAAGMDHCLVPEVIESDILVSSASGVLANQVADHTLALLLGLLRSLPVFFRAQQQKEFIRRPTRDLYGARIGIVGLGGNGRRLAEVFQPFNVRLLATDWFPEDRPEGVEALLAADRLDEILPEVDVLILAAPLNDLTRGMIDARRLALLPEGALLVNMARGPLVVESDLVDALESGHLGGAGLDVTELEPLPVESRLWEQPNAIITPHVGGQSASRIDDMTNLFCANLSRYFADRSPLNYLAEKRLGFPHPEHAAWRG